MSRVPTHYYEGDLTDTSTIRKLPNAIETIHRKSGDVVCDIYLTRDGKIVLVADGEKPRIQNPLKSEKFPYINLDYDWSDGSNSRRLDRGVAAVFSDMVEHENDGKMFLVHKDGNMYNCSVENLKWTDNPTEDGICDMRKAKRPPIRCIETGEIFATQKEVADHFHVTVGHVSGVLKGTWGSSTVRKHHIEYVTEE